MCSTKLGQKVMSINMRYKQTYGWSHRFSYCFYFENGQKAVDPVWVVNWGKIFFSNDKSSLLVTLVSILTWTVLEILQ